MAGHRFQVTMSMCFTIHADNLSEAQERAHEFVDSFSMGAEVGPNCGDFSDADARVYSNDPELEIVDIEGEYEEQA